VKFTAALRLEGKKFGSAAYNGGLGFNQHCLFVDYEVILKTLLEIFFLFGSFQFSFKLWLNDGAIQ
jgi:hypothetical protein